MGAAAAYSEPVSADMDPHEETGDRYYYGYRTIIEYDEDGECVITYRPLTPDDLLDPEEGDVYMLGTLHNRDVERLRSIIRFRLRDREDMTVYSDLKMDWGVEDLPNPAPDISVIRNVRDPDRPRGVFYVSEEGVIPCFILEVVSPRYRNADINKKPDIYRRAGVSECFIVDPGLKDDEISYTIRGYKLIGNRYVSATPDTRGRFYSKLTDVWLGVSESGDRIIVIDGRTGEELLSDEERADKETEARQIAEARAETAEARADQESEARESAEARAETAEARADQKSEARESAEARAEQESEARESAEAELRRLRAEIARLRGGK
ncbi:Uma2 family endonuclease [Desulfobacterales bacterium HSG2]|nr:Uma2 family endonuclease [Desulfobacterales bacterium HSG2]